jgi:hypothetical protein
VIHGVRKRDAGIMTPTKPLAMPHQAVNGNTMTGVRVVRLTGLRIAGSMIAIPPNAH